MPCWRLGGCGLGIPVQGPRRCGPRVSCVGASQGHAYFKGTWSGKLLGGQWTGSSLAGYLGTEAHSPGAFLLIWVPAGAMLMGSWGWMGAVWGSPRLATPYMRVSWRWEGHGQGESA